MDKVVKAGAERRKKSQHGTLVTTKKTLDDALKHKWPDGKGPVYIKRAECDKPGWEGEWARVQRMRKEGHRLVFGGGSS